MAEKTNRPNFLMRNGAYYSFNRYTLFKDCLEENLIILLCISYLLITKKSINFIHLFVAYGLNSSLLFKIWLKGHGPFHSEIPSASWSLIAMATFISPTRSSQTFQQNEFLI